MSTDSTGKDPLERLLSGQPVRPSKDFTDKTLSRIHAEAKKPMSEDELDRQLDAWLSAQPLRPSAEFAQNTVDTTTGTPQAHRQQGWMWTAVGMAAMVAVGIFSAIMITRDEPTPRYDAYASTSAQPLAAPQAAMLAADEEGDSELGDTPDFLFATTRSARTDDLSDLIMMQDALVEVAALSNQDTIEALDLLVN
ncbi:hypothetical protein [Ruficoccus sp. ZRK36]|uniref:hypothetical protein n=1 Tax=Ruficoccus sp. ZRK36 TaxID=2866311 RepID=UPI001C73B3C5|nr:hypothetical protein [Ruficoccus sp. ZRK36]QYY37109.1 hypothetical protein K0V07_06405 [Ruficoccus sp. ZRK36]